MSDDPVDRMFDQAAGCALAAVFGFFISLLFGQWQTKQHEKWAEERRLKLPDVLELPDDFDRTLFRRKPKQLITKTKWQQLLTGYGMFATGLISVYGVIGIFVFLGNSQNFGNRLLSMFSFVVAAGSGYATYRLWQRQRGLKEKPKRKFVTVQTHIPPLDLSQARRYTIRLPKSAEWHPVMAARFMEQLIHKTQRLTFQIVARQGQISWQILDLRRKLHPDVITQAVHAFYPAADIEVVDVEWESFIEPFYRYIMSFEQQDEPLFPIQYAENLTNFDPLINIVQEMSHLQQGEQIIYTVFVGDIAEFAYEQVEDLLTVKQGVNPLQLLSPGGWAEAGYQLSAQDRQRLEVFDAQDMEVVTTKITNVLVQALLLIQIDAGSPQRVKDLARISSHVRHYNNFPYGFLVWHEEPLPESVQYIDTLDTARQSSTLGRLNAWLTNDSRNWQDFRLILDTHELAALWHLPYPGFTAPAIEWSRSRVEIPQKMRENWDGVLLGMNHFSGRSEPVYLPDQDRATHANILGRTGVGKSTLLHHLITQDIVKGHGVAVIDPHGKLVRDILQTSIPEAREADVVLLDLADTEHPPPINPLAGTQSRAATARVIGILNKIYGGFESAPRMANALTSALATLRHEPQATVRDVVRLFTDETYRARLLAELDDVVAEEFWHDEYDVVSTAQQQQIREPVIYRMRSFYNIPDLYPVICHPDRLDFEQLMNERKIILVSLAMDEERIPERERNLIGAILVSQLQMAAMKRTDREQPFYLYIDEVQNFVTTALDKVFSEARKFGLALTVANQYLQQLAGNTLDAIMGNVGAMVVFQCGLDDARRLAPYMAPGFTAEDLVNLDKYEAVVKLRVDGETQPAFSLSPLEPHTIETFSPDERFAYRQKELRIRQLSQVAYTPKTRGEVLTWLKQRYPRRKKAAGMADAGDFYED